MTYFIKEIPNEERPRERLVKHGPKSLQTHELIAILLETGTKRESVLDLSKRLLYEINQSSNLSAVTYHELIKINGIKMAKACKVIAAIELGKRLNSDSLTKPTKIKTPFDIYHLLVDETRGLLQESLFVIYLSTQGEVITIENIFKGTLNQLLIHPREIFKRAYQLSSNALILIHNHPSGNSNPSQQDLLITQNIIDVGEVLQIEVIDHVIIGDNEFYSIKNNKKTIL